MAETVETPKFGTVGYAEADIIQVDGGLPGFEALRRFLLIESESYSPIKFLQSLDDPIISFPVIDPRLIRPDYSLPLSEDQMGELGLTRLDEGLAYSIVTLGKCPEEASANLFAPLVINISKMKASQVILLGSDYSISEPLLRG